MFPVPANPAGTVTDGRPTIPLETLFGNPERAMPRLSPDGARLAWLAPDEGILNVFVGTSLGAADARPVTRDRDRGVRIYFWTYDGRSILYLQDAAGDENWHLHRVDLESGAVTDLTPFDRVQVQVVEYSKHHPTRMLLAINRRDERLHDVYSLDLTSGALELVVENPGTVIGWVADRDLAVRAALAARSDGGFDLQVRSDAAGAWATVLTWTSDENLNSHPLGFDAAGTTLFLTDSRRSNTARLVALDLATGAEQVIAEDPAYDVTDVVLNPDTREVQLVAFARARLEWEVVDRSLTPDLEVIRRLDSGDFNIVDRTLADDRWLVAFTRDAGPVAWYELDRRNHQARFLFHDRPALAGYQLATMEPIEFTSSDGLTIHGYLTLPPGEDRDDPHPLVLDVHGGPWARDMWGYDAEAQWLANRGYACLQVNYRGSTGYGKDFINAGDKEWGGRMHQDLVDAVHWAVGKGIADRERIAIYGGSYGGYAALVGATFTPDLFCCAVDIVGPSNLLTFIDSIPPYWSTYLEVLHQRVGNPETEREFLESRSPINRVDGIRIPLLIAQGANDPRVKQAESEQIVAALKAKGIDYQYLLFEDEGHGFAKPENRLRFYRAAEQFLARHLGGRPGASSATAPDRPVGT